MIWRTTAPWVMALLMLAGNFARAQSSSGEVDLQTAFAGVIAGRLLDDQWFPIIYTLANPGEEVAIQIRVEPMNEGSPTGRIYQQNLVMPANSRLRGEIPVRNEKADDFKVVVIREDGVNLGSLSAVVSWMSPPDFGILIHEESPVGFLWFSKSTIQGKPITAIRKNSGSFPTRSEFLTANFPLILSSQKGKISLNSAQQEALFHYMVSGGILIVCGWTQGDLPPDSPLLEHFPVLTLSERLPRGIHPTNSFWDAPWPDTSFPRWEAVALPGTEVAIQDATGPLVAMRPVGRGALIWTAFPLNDPIFSEWTQRSQFLEWAIQTGQGKPLSAHQTPLSDFQEIALGQRLLPEIPSFRAVALAIGFFFSLILASWIWAKTRRKLEYAWIGIAALTPFFAWGIYYAGQTLRTYATYTADTFEFIRSNADGTVGDGYAFNSVFSPIRFAVDLPSEQRTDLISGPIASSNQNLLARQQRTIRYDFTQGKLQIPQILLREGSPMLTRSSWFLESTDAVSSWDSAKIDLSEGVFRGTYTGTRHLAFAGVWFNRFWLPLGPINPGQQVSISLSRGRAFTHPSEILNDLPKDLADYAIVHRTLSYFLEREQTAIGTMNSPQVVGLSDQLHAKRQKIHPAPEENWGYSWNEWRIPIEAKGGSVRTYPGMLAWAPKSNLRSWLPQEPEEGEHNQRRLPETANLIFQIPPSLWPIDWTAISVISPAPLHGEVAEAPRLRLFRLTDESWQNVDRGWEGSAETWLDLNRQIQIQTQFPQQQSGRVGWTPPEVILQGQSPHHD